MGSISQTASTALPVEADGLNRISSHIASNSGLELQHPTTEPSTSTPSPVEATPLGAMFQYRWRMHLTLAVLLVAWIGAGLSPPFVQNGSLPAILSDYVGWLMFFGGLSLRFWATRFIGGRKSREVISYGPYSLTRNPLYVGTFLMILSLSFFLKSPTFTVATAIVIAYYCVAVVPLEERFLRQAFGVDYSNYCDSVPRWLPRVGTIYAPPVDLIAQPMQSEARRAAWWLLLPLLAELHTYCRAFPEWPHLLNWP